jgi:hypothetical protein
MIMKSSLVSALLVLLSVVLVPSSPVDAANGQVRVRDAVHTVLQQCDVIYRTLSTHIHRFLL